MSNAVVSIIIPSYQQGHFLSGAIESALGQTYSPVQVVVVNDGSDDQTEAVAKQYGTKLTYVIKPNGGVGSARNAGIGMAAGRYLLFLDADDLLHPDAIDWLVTCMEGKENRQCVMGLRFFTSDPYKSYLDHRPSDTAATFQRVFEIDPLLAHKPKSLSGNRLSPLPFLLYNSFGPPHCCLFARKTVIDIGMFDEDLSISGCADWDLCLRLALAGVELATTPNIGAFYRRHPSSMSTDLGKMLNSRAKILLKTSKEFSMRPDLRREWNVHLVQAARRTRRRYVAYGLSSPIASEVSKLLRSNPPEVGHFSSRWQHVNDRYLGAWGDALALAYYRLSRPDLLAYYRSDID